MDFTGSAHPDRNEKAIERYRCGVVGLFGIAVLLCALLFGAQIAAASVVEALSLSELVKRAEQVVVVTPGEHMGRRSGNLIVTDVQLRVDESLKGGAKRGETLIATLLGGVADGVGLKVPGEAALPAGAQYVVFLRRQPESRELRVVGMAQGVLPIEQRSGKAMVLPPAHDAELMQRGSDGRLKEGEPAVTTELALPELLTRIRSLVASGAQPAR